MKIPLPKDRQKVCATCACWQKNDKTSAGICRSGPPGERGWPTTQPADWCVVGWKKGVVQVTAAQPMSNWSTIAVNFAFIEKYPGKAMQWREEALKGDIPEVLAPLFRDKAPDHATRSLPMFGDANAPGCEEMFNWSEQFAGANNDDEVGLKDSDYQSIFIYQDTPTEIRANQEARARLPKDSIWRTT